MQEDSPTKFKTIDQLIDFYTYLANPKQANHIYPTIEWIVHTCVKEILEVLMLSTNGPSKYDLYIIQVVSFRTNSPVGGGVFKSILEFYKNRKE